MESDLKKLVDEGLLRPISGQGSPEWRVPPKDHKVPNPPEGYVVSFIKFHRYRLGSPPSRFMRALVHRFNYELHHFTPNAINHAAIFAAFCEGYLGIAPHWELFLHFYQAEFQMHIVKDSGNLLLHCGSISLCPKRPKEFIPVKVGTNNFGWDSEWFYLRDDNGWFPAFSGRPITGRESH